MSTKLGRWRLITASGVSARRDTALHFLASSRDNHLPEGVVSFSTLPTMCYRGTYLVYYVTFPLVKVSLDYRPHTKHSCFCMLDGAFPSAVAEYGGIPGIERGAEVKLQK